MDLDPVGAVAVLSDIHGMLPLLDRVLDEAEVRAADLIVVTGDHVWGPQGAEVLDRLRELGDRCLPIRGNADRELLGIARGEGGPRDPMSIWSAAQLTVAHQEQIAGMPDRAIVDVDGFGPVLFCHATPRSDEEVVLVDDDAEAWGAVFDGIPPDVGTVVCGHTHMPFVRLVGHRLVVNPGSVGLPYGRSGSHWAVLRSGAVTLGRTSVDPTAVTRALEASSSTFPGVRGWVLDLFDPTPSTEVAATSLRAVPSADESGHAAAAD